MISAEDFPGWFALLIEPGNRFRVSHPSGYVGPGFIASDLFSWGFTAGILDRLLRLAGRERPWDEAKVAPPPAEHPTREPRP